MLDTLQIHNVYTHSGYLNYKTGKLAQNLGVTIMYQSYAIIACAIIASPDSVSPSSLIYNYSVWGQSSECENPVTLSLSSWLRCYCYGSLQFLPLPGLYRVVWLAEVGYDWLLCLHSFQCPDAGLESVHSDMQGILCVKVHLQIKSL